jgi:hypothetical protein
MGSWDNPSETSETAGRNCMFWHLAPLWPKLAKQLYSHRHEVYLSAVGPMASIDVHMQQLEHITDRKITLKVFSCVPHGSHWTFFTELRIVLSSYFCAKDGRRLKWKYASPVQNNTVYFLRVTKISVAQAYIGIRGAFPQVWKPVTLSKLITLFRYEPVTNSPQHAFESNLSAL